MVGDTHASIRRTHTLFGKVEKENLVDASGSDTGRAESDAHAILRAGGST